METGLKVRVHYNLIAGDWVVTYRGKTERVEEITLRDARPVYWGGRDGSDGRKATGQWLSTHGGKRTVHAWIEGIVAAPASGGEEIAYNPKRAAYFHTRDGREVVGCAVVRFGADRHAYGLGVRHV